MSRVEIASMPWGVLQDRHGESQNGLTATLKNLNGTNATTWSAVTGGSSSTASLTADANGNLPRFVEGGQYTLDVPALGVSGRRVEAVSGSVESGTVVFADAYGALGDGSTDDTTALAAAITAADGKRLVLRPGATYVYSSILYTATSGILIDGQNATLKSTLGKTTNTAAFWIKGSDVTIRNLTFDFTTSITVADESGNRAGNAHTIRVGGSSFGALASRVTVENVKVFNSRNTPVIANFVDRLRVQGCTFQNAYGNGLFVGDSGTHIRLIGNSIYNVGDDGIGIYQPTALGARIKDVVIANNHVELCDAKGIGVGGVSGCTITGNTVRNTYTPGIFVIEDTSFSLDAADKVLIANNVVDSGGKNYGNRNGAGSPVVYGHTAAATIPYGIAVSGSNDDIKIHGNIVTNTEGRAINVEGTVNTGLGITGNRVKTAGGVGIQVSDPDGSTFTKAVNVTVAANEVSSTVAGIIIGSATNVSVSGNRVSSYKNGATGTRRGITFGKVSNGQITGNTVYNDDGGAETVFTYNACAQVRHHGNFEQATGDGDAGNVFTIGTRRITFGSTSPAAGTWQRGDVCFNTNVGVSAPDGAFWICTTAGTPGTWRKTGFPGLAAIGDAGGTWDPGSMAGADLQATTTWDPGSLAVGASERKSVTVTGAALGDPATAGLSTIAATGWDITAAVIATDTVEVKITNNTAGVVDLGSGTVRVSVQKGAKSVSNSFTVSGTALGDYAIAKSSIAVPAGVMVSAHVTATDTVQVTLTNTTAAAVDLASSTWRVLTFRTGIS